MQSHFLVYQQAFLVISIQILDIVNDTLWIHLILLYSQCVMDHGITLQRQETVHCLQYPIMDNSQHPIFNT